MNISAAFLLLVNSILYAFSMSGQQLMKRAASANALLDSADTRRPAIEIDSL